jgi:8-oxo-dGTP pyrophosphatase MutT (NUDIX family)
MAKGHFPYEKLQEILIGGICVNLQNIVGQLQTHPTIDEVEAMHLMHTLDFVSRNPDNFWCRTNQSGHLTASAFVVNKEHSHALMLHHATLQKWLQPGGHIDDSDLNPAAAALRETMEETGATVLGGGSSTLFDIDVHPIPARNKLGKLEPAHLHYDLRYVLVASTTDVTISDESFGFRWVSLSILAGGNGESGIARMARKFLNRREDNGTRRYS